VTEKIKKWKFFEELISFRQKYGHGYVIFSIALYIFSFLGIKYPLDLVHNSRRSGFVESWSL
jgi:hypothetical protein